MTKTTGRTAENEKSLNKNQYKESKFKRITRASAEGQSIYKCMDPGCPYSNLLNAALTSVGSTWGCALNVNYVIATVLGLWTYKSILKMST